MSVPFTATQSSGNVKRLSAVRWSTFMKLLSVTYTVHAAHACLFVVVFHKQKWGVHVWDSCTLALNRCQGTPVWAGARREVCFCLTLVSSLLRLPGRGIGTGPAVWPSSPVAHPQTHPALDQAPSRRTMPPIWWGFLVVFGTSCIPT